LTAWLDDVAQLAQQRAPAGEQWPQQAGDGEHILPMRHRGEDVGLHPFAVGEHPLLVAARAEVPRLARKGEDEAMPALIAVDPRKPTPWIAALEKPSDDAFLDTAAEAVTCP